jgi:hypothetical protein
MNRSNLIATLQQIKALADEALKEHRPSSSRSAPGAAAKTTFSKPIYQQIDLDMPMRAFIKKHARSLSGPKRFALLVARLAKGKTNVVIQMKDLNHHWNKMRGLLGGELKRVYSTRAKEGGWIDTEKHGSYRLTSAWKNILV